MDIDSFISRNHPAWDRLDELSGRAGRGGRRLTPAQVDELVDTYQRVSSHLSYARSAFDDAALTGRLSRTVGRAAGVIYGSRSRPLQAISDFFAWRFPAAVWQSGRFIAVSAALLLVPALAVGTWIATSDAALEASAPDAVREAYLDEDFESYYSSAPASEFATQVTVNNIQVAFLAFAVGALLCVPTAVIMVTNGANVGFAGGLFADAGQLDKFFGLILPHGLLELTAVVIAGAAGLRLGWAVIAPGDRTRGQALGHEARRAGVVALGLVLAFVVAGVIEGFVTGRGVPTGLRVGIGVVAELAFVGWIVVQGRAATRRGVTGEIGELDRGWDELATARERAWASPT
ncbi:MAG TPA: stage II sporulation protein M [Acidimicrobiales bacterium]|nr:stage II sporulation protein M [Acidimicrobiales bacterium]